ncbi:MAG: hypothetical protein ACREDV_02910, partial [Methylocella sp.]
MDPKTLHDGVGAGAFHVRSETLSELRESLGALKQLRLLNPNENLLDPELAAAYEPRSFPLGCFALSLDGRQWQHQTGRNLIMKINSASATSFLKCSVGGRRRAASFWGEVRKFVPRCGQRMIFSKPVVLAYVLPVFCQSFLAGAGSAAPADCPGITLS